MHFTKYLLLKTQKKYSKKNKYLGRLMEVINCIFIAWLKNGTLFLYSYLDD